MNLKGINLLITHYCMGWIFITTTLSFHLDAQIVADSTVEMFEQKVDSFMQIAIDSQAFPGAQVLVAKDGQIIFEKAYGYHTYSNEIKVETHHLYDLASITKVSTGLPILMNLIARDKIDLDVPVSYYLKDWKRSNKRDLTLREILAHQGGLTPYIYYPAKMKDGEGHWRRKTFKNQPKGKYKLPITDSLYLHKKYHKKMRQRIRDTPLGEKKYKYSGLLFQLLPALIEKIKGHPYLTVLNRELYAPLGITEDLTYLPLDKKSKEEIIPTEIDTNFRNLLVHGTVHDEAAAMWSGVSCNAGLFGNARGLLNIFQLYLDGGNHNGIQLIDSTTLSEFTQCQYCDTDNRRGLGFDKPRIEYDANLSSVAKDASPESFGHTGFTGTLVWADPVHDLIYIFLSNRVHPYRSHKMIYKMNVRPTIHQWAYEYLR